MLFLPLAITSATLFGISKTTDKKGLAGANLLVGLLYRNFIGAPILLCFSILSGDFFIAYNYDFWTVVYSALAGVSSLVVGTLCLFATIRILGAARASVIVSTQVLFAPLLSVAALTEIMSFQLVIGTLVIYFGMILLSYSNPRVEGKDLIPSKKFRKGLMLGLMCGFFWAVSQVFGRKAVSGFGSTIMVSFIAYLFAILTLVLIILFSLPKRTLKLERTSKIYLLASGIITAASYLSRYAALQLAPVVLVIPISGISPLVTVVISYFFIQESERIDKKVILGAIAVVIGTTLVAMYAQETP